MKSCIEFWAGVEEEFPHLSRKALNILLPFAASHLCETGFSAVAAIKTKYRSVMNLENELRVAISNPQHRYDKYVKRCNHIRPTNPDIKRIFCFSHSN
jgi:hypothetical protein